MVYEAAVLGCQGGWAPSGLGAAALNRAGHVWGGVRAGPVLELGAGTPGLERSGPTRLMLPYDERFV